MANAHISIDVCLAGAALAKQLLGSGPWPGSCRNCGRKERKKEYAMGVGWGGQLAIKPRAHQPATGNCGSQGRQGVQHGLHVPDCTQQTLHRCTVASQARWRRCRRQQASSCKCLESESAPLAPERYDWVAGIMRASPTSATLARPCSVSSTFCGAGGGWQGRR